MQTVIPQLKPSPVWQVAIYTSQRGCTYGKSRRTQQVGNGIAKYDQLQKVVIHPYIHKRYCYGSITIGSTYQYISYPIGVTPFL